MRRISVAVLGAAGLLTACSSGGLLGSATNPGSDPATQARYLAASFDSAAISNISATELPTIARLKGIVRADLLKANATSADEMVIGTTEFVADFTNGSLSGTASDFALYDRLMNNETAAPGDKLADLGGALAVTGSISGTRFDYRAHGNLSGPASNGGTADVEVSLISGNGQVPVYMEEDIAREPVYSGSYALGSMGEPIMDPVVVVDTMHPVSGFADADGRLVAAATLSGTFAPMPGSALVAGSLQDGLLLAVEQN